MVLNVSGENITIKMLEFNKSTNEYSNGDMFESFEKNLYNKSLNDTPELDTRDFLDIVSRWTFECAKYNDRNPENYFMLDMFDDEIEKEFSKEKEIRIIIS